MTRFQILGRTSLMAGLLCGTSAMADVTAQQVWDNWKEQLAIYGDASIVIGPETASGDTLTVDSITISVDDDDVSVESVMGPLVFTELGDGRVQVDLPASYPLSMVADDVTFSITVSTDSGVIIASGDPDAISYDLTADRYAFTVDSLGEQFEEEGEINSAVLAFNDIDGTYSVRTGTLQQLDYLLNVASVEADFDLREKTGDGRVIFNASMENLIAAAKLAIPEDFDPDDADAMFIDGFSFEGGYSVGATAYAIDVDIEGDVVNGALTLASAGLELAMDLDGARYTGGSQDVAFEMFVPSELPFPIEASMAEYGLDFLVPLSKSDDPRDFGAGIRLRDLTISDSLWSLVDPGAVLPRDPATVVLDLTGQAKILFNFLDPADQMAAAMSDMPAELNAVSINEIIVRLAGAELLGDGGFTFDVTDTTTFPGFPRPEGTVELQLTGSNALIDNLVQLGFIAPDEAMMPRMMLGMFATSVGEDQLRSVIEVNDQGHVLANGQRLQ